MRPRRFSEFIFSCFDCKLDLEFIHGALDPGGPPLSTPSMRFGCQLNSCISVVTVVLQI